MLPRRQGPALSAGMSPFPGISRPLSAGGFFLLFELDSDLLYFSRSACFIQRGIDRRARLGRLRDIPSALRLLEGSFPRSGCRMRHRDRILRDLYSLCSTEQIACHRHRCTFLRGSLRHLFCRDFLHAPRGPFDGLFARLRLGPALCHRRLCGRISLRCHMSSLFFPKYDLALVKVDTLDFIPTING